MIHAKYPIIDSPDFIKVSLDKMEKDPLSEYGDYRCLCTVVTPLGKEEFYAYGVDQVQVVWLGLQKIKGSIEQYEAKNNKKCEYTFFIDGSDFINTSE